MFNQTRRAGGERRPSVDEIIAQTTAPIQPPRRRSGRSFGWLKLVVLLLFAALIVALVVLYGNYQQLKKEQAKWQASQAAAIDPNNLSDEELVLHIGELAELPSGTSTIATVRDVENLAKRDPFFNRAQNGDKVLLFDGQAILYRPASDRIINFGPVNDSSTSPESAATSTAAAPSAPLTIEIRNGTATAGLAAKWKKTLADKSELYRVEKVGNAAVDTYTQTQLVNLGNKDVSTLEQIFGVRAVTELPSGETASSQQVLVILGK